MKSRRPISLWIVGLTYLIGVLGMGLCPLLVGFYPTYVPLGGSASDRLNGYFLAPLFEGSRHLVALTVAGLLGAWGVSRGSLWSMELAVVEPTTIELLRQRERKGIKPYVFALLGAAFGLGTALAVHAIPASLAVRIVAFALTPWPVATTFYYLYLVKPYSLDDKHSPKAKEQGGPKNHTND